MNAYKIVETQTPEKNKLGGLFLVDEWLGHRHTFNTYNAETMCFEPTFTARYLGKVTARSEKERVKQLLALPGTSHARKKKS